MSYTTTGCSTCGPEICSCDRGRSISRWQPSMTLERACSLVHILLASVGCEVTCPDYEICKLLRAECEICAGRLELGTLALLVAARMLEIEAVVFARQGTVKTLTVTFDGNKTSQELQDIAKAWREQAMACAPRRRFSAIRTGKSMVRRQVLSGLYHKANCRQYRYDRLDEEIATNCNFDCCDGCVEDG